MAHTLKLEQKMVNTLVEVLTHSFDSTPSLEEARSKAEQVAILYGDEVNLNPIIKQALMEITSRMSSGVSLILQDTSHDSDWLFKREDIDWTYTDAYFKYLEKSPGWSSRLCQSLRDVSKNILGLLQDPISDGKWDRRGLVIGSVQSGKTANYLALIARAADAGYKFFIVVAGTHNVLRSQTQKRIDAGFVGRNSESKSQKIGVGDLNPNQPYRFPHPVTLTTVSSDFNKQTARQSGWELNDLSKPIILVVKKNVNVLNSLYYWLKDMNARGGDQIETAPMLLIDDEADYASINTNEPEQDPTKTNQLVRQILKLFAKSSFVGYTATPFANIFVNPEAYDEKLYEDLFPRDFIYCLDPPNNYFGPEKVFLGEKSPSEFLIPITDCEDLLPRSHKKDHDLYDLPGSLIQAMNVFVLARAIRNLRGYRAHHCSMMINVSTFTDIQKVIRDLVSIYLRKFKAAVSANYAMSDSFSSKNAYIKNLKSVYKEVYPDCEISWENIKSALHEATSSIRLFLINSKSDEKLDYGKYESNTSGLTAIAIGGISLSRGLTLEGLCVSYIYRNTRTYDTLMQMGRWFGYRTGYEDLCRIYLSEDAISWYSYIAEASHELVAQIREMRLMDKTPKDFGLYVRSHPNRLLITSPRKMQRAKRIKLLKNYSCRLEEFYALPLDISVNSENEQLIVDTWGKENLEPANRPGKEASKGWIVRDVPVERVVNFVTRFTIHHTLEHKKDGIIKYLRVNSDQYRTCDVVLISTDDEGESENLLRLGAQERASNDEIEGDTWSLRNARVASRGDEGLGLSKRQVLEALRIRKQRLQAKGLTDSEHYPQNLSDVYYRMVRRHPLLMVHVLTGKPNSPLENARIPTIGISFPQDNYTTEVEVVANRVYIEQESASVHGEEGPDWEMEED